MSWWHLLLATTWKNPKIGLNIHIWGVTTRGFFLGKELKHLIKNQNSNIWCWWTNWFSISPLTCTASLECPGHLTCISLDCGSKPLQTRGEHVTKSTQKVVRCSEGNNPPVWRWMKTSCLSSSQLTLPMAKGSGSLPWRGFLVRLLVYFQQSFWWL